MTRQRSKERRSNVSCEPRSFALPLPRTIGQERLLTALCDDEVDIVVVTGPAGTGKTFIATAWALWAVRAGLYQRICVTRPVVPVDDRDVGYLPGDIESKMSPWLRPVLRLLRDRAGDGWVETSLRNGTLEIVAMPFVRGYTFDDSIVILDEAQGTTPTSMLSMLTRVGNKTKLVVCGDIDQSDLAPGTSGLAVLVRKLERVPTRRIRLVRLGVDDIQRSEAVREVLSLGILAVVGESALAA